MRAGSGKGRKRILFVAEAVTLAHVARAFTLAKLLDPQRYRVKVVCDPRYRFLFETDQVECGDINSISTAAFTDALNRGSPVYQFDTLLAYAEEDIRVLREFDPDVVIGDFRISLGASARVARKPYINVTNAGWSPYARPRFVVPDIGLTRAVGSRVGQWLFDAARPLSFALHAGPMNRLRRHYGLALLPRDVRMTYTDGDYTLYADLAELIPLVNAPATHAFLGPVLWSAKPPPPEWAERVPADRPLVYVALGSSGKHAMLPTIIDALAGNALTIVSATTGKDGASASAPNVFVADFLDGDAWARRASVVVCNGGSPTCYQALNEGVPVLGIPSNLDQYLNMSAVADHGAGVLLRSDEVSAPRVRAAVDTLLQQSSYRSTAQRLARAIAASDPAATLADTCERAMRAVH